MPAEPALRCVDLCVSYDGTRAVDGVDLIVQPGEIVALLGASGSGKSTLLHAVAGLVPASAGEIWLGGRRVADARRSTPPEQRAVGLVFQDFALWPHLSALDTVAYPLRRAGTPRAQARAAAQRLLDQLDVGALRDRVPATLSGGQQQRIGLARALARDPRLFLLDEPTAHLDTHLRGAFQDCVRDRQASTGAAAICATHDAAEALALADRVAIIVSGRLVQLDAPQFAYSQPVNAAAAALTGSCDVLTVPVCAQPGGYLGLTLGDTVLTVPGAGTDDSRCRRRPVLVRPEWLRIGGPLKGRVTASAFRGPCTVYRLDTRWGTVSLQTDGPPRHGIGDEVAWGIERAWVLPGAEDVSPVVAADQPSAVSAPG